MTKTQMNKLTKADLVEMVQDLTSQLAEAQQERKVARCAIHTLTKEINRLRKRQYKFPNYVDLQEVRKAAEEAVAKGQDYTLMPDRQARS